MTRKEEIDKQMEELRKERLNLEKEEKKKLESEKELRMKVIKEKEKELSELYKSYIKDYGYLATDYTYSDWSDLIPNLFGALR